MKYSLLGRLAALLCPLVLAVGCSSGPPEGQAAHVLSDRLQAQLAPALANGQAGLEQYPDGARVTLSEQALFAPGSAVLDNQGRDLLASVMEGLLAPPRLQIDVADAPDTPGGLRAARAAAVTQFLRDYAIGPNLQFAALQQGGMPPAGIGVSPGVAISVTVTSRPAG